MIEKITFTVEKTSETITNIDKLLELDLQKREKLIELKRQLIRINRALQSDFWLKDWKKKTLKEKTKIMREDICIKFQSNDSIFRDLDDFEFYAKKQWIKDREQLISEGKIKVEQSV